jgi:hypothetical protein
MGTGEVVFALDFPGYWLPVLPRSIGLSLWEFACKDKQKGIRQAELLWISPMLKESSSVAASAFLHQTHWQMQ